MEIDQKWRQVAKIGLPSLGSVLLEPILGATDLAMVGHVSPLALGALGLAISAINFITVPLASIAFALTSRVARLSAKADPNDLAAFATTATIALFLAGVVLALLLVAIVPLVISAATTNPTVRHFGIIYLRISVFSLPFYLGSQAVAAYLTGLGRTGRAFIVEGIVVVVNIAAEAIFIFGFSMSVVGSALGSLIAQLLGAILFSFSIQIKGLRWTSTIAALANFIREFYKLGVSLISRTLALMGALSGSIYFASYFGTSDLASFQIGQTIWLLFGLSFDAIAVPAQVMVGQWHGLSAWKEIRIWSRKLILLGLFASVIIAFAMVIFSAFLAKVFTSSPALIPSAKRAIYVVAALMPPTALSFTLDGLVSGTESFNLLRNAMIVALLAMVVVDMVLIVFHVHISQTIIWLPFAIWITVRGITVLLAWRALIRQNLLGKTA
ncbi:MATE family efflux transporter [Acidithrix sp. C25]|uniref:MATE family efflux transporter n=1 Tax=Acidithrix sp. C25 TaxID=1671482 RepID=UPI00191BAA2E|nr:MATE family efflux transporter [Acidithrix sp. C25]CAG4912837.1 unnamed protein product [Acidithrix sp. C25]